MKTHRQRLLISVDHDTPDTYENTYPINLIVRPVEGGFALDAYLSVDEAEQVAHALLAAAQSFRTSRPLSNLEVLTSEVLSRDFTKPNESRAKK